MMKKIMLSVIAILIAGLGFEGQSQTPGEFKKMPKDLNAIPGIFSKSDTGLLVTDEMDESNTSVTYHFFDENLNEISSFAHPVSRIMNSYHEKFPRIWEYNPESNNESHNKTVSKEDVLNVINERFVNCVSSAVYDGKTYYYPTPGKTEEELGEYYNRYSNLFISPNSFGACLYPNIAFTYDKTYSILTEIKLTSDSYIHTDKYSETGIIERENYKDDEGISNLVYMNINAGFEAEHYLYFTQTLFNDDEAFEYLEPVYDFVVSSVSSYPYAEYCKTAYWNTEPVGYNICNSNGEKLMSLSFDGYYEVYAPRIYIIGTKTYLEFRVRERDNVKDSEFISTQPEETWFYEIKKSSTGVKIADKPVRIKVSPSIVSDGQPVNIELQEMGGEGRLSVSDISGRTLYRQQVNEDGVYHIYGNSLNEGMNVVAVETAKGKETFKVIKK